MIDVRPMVRADVDIALDLWHQLMLAGQAADPRYVPAPDAKDLFRDTVRNDWLIDRPFPRVLIGWDGDRAVGYIQGYEAPPRGIFVAGKTAKIGDLYVVEAARRRGLARRLVNAFQERARAAGCVEFEVGTLVRDARAVAFWQAMGFVEMTVQLRLTS